MLTDADLNSMRATTGEALPDTCVIQRGTAVSDSGGGASLSWVAVGTVDCRIAPAGLRGAEGETGERISSDTDFILTVPSATTIATDYRAVVSGDTYTVVGVRDRSWPLTKRVELTRFVP